jgi:hypothetical protein
MDIGMAIESSASNAHHVYAVDSSEEKIPYGRRVRLIAAWTNRSSGEFKIELISEESLLMRGSRCKSLATELQRAFPPI